MPRSRIALLTVLSLRVAYGVGLLAAPDRLSKRWLGALDDAARVGLRALGTREIALHSLAIAAVLGDGPVRPLLAASIAGDLSDIAATFASRPGLPSGSPLATAIVAGGSAALTAAAGRAADR